MDAHLEAFKQALIADGYLDVELKTIAPDHRIPLHSHPWDVRALVVAGSAVIGCEGEAPREYRPGDVLVVAADRMHFEDYGPEGYTFLVGRRREPPGIEPSPCTSAVASADEGCIASSHSRTKADS